MQARQPSSPLENLLIEDPGLNNILNRLEVRDCARLARTCYSMSEFFKADLPIRLINLSYYINNEPNDDKVKFILTNNLKLLNFKFEKVIRETQTFLNVTPLQLAYGAKDDVMCHTLKPLFIELYGSEQAGIDEMQKQISEIKDDHKPFDFNPIIQAISKESFNHSCDAETNRPILSQATLAAIDQFKKDFDAAQLKRIDKGIHFRWETLEELFEHYVREAAQWDYNKCALFEDAVITLVLKNVPENGAQSFNQGLYYLHNDNPEPYKRARITRDGHNFRYALKNSCVDIIFGVCQGDLMVSENTLALIKTYVKQKTSNLQNLCSSSQGVSLRRM